MEPLKIRKGRTPAGLRKLNDWCGRRESNPHGL